MSEPVTAPSQPSSLGAFKFWNKKEKEMKDIPDVKKNGLSKEFLWTFILNNDTEYDETRCIQQLSEVRKVWSVIGTMSSNKVKKDHQRKTSSFGKDIVQMIQENYKFMNEGKAQWEEAFMKMTNTVNQLNEDNEALKEQVRTLKNEKMRHSSIVKKESTLHEIELQLQNLVKLNNQIESKLSVISIQQSNDSLIQKSINEKVELIEKNINSHTLSKIPSLSFNTIDEEMSLHQIDDNENKTKTPELPDHYYTDNSVIPTIPLKNTIVINDYQPSEQTEEKLNHTQNDIVISSKKTLPIQIDQFNGCDDFVVHRLDQQPLVSSYENNEHALILEEDNIPHLGNVPSVQRKTSHVMSRSVGDANFLDEIHQDMSTQSTPYRLMKMPLRRYISSSKHNELFISPATKRSRSILSSQQMTLSHEELTMKVKKPLVRINQSSDNLTPRSKKDHELKEKEEELKQREEILKKKEEEVSQKEKEVLVVQIEIENREEELQSWEDDIQRRENEIREREGEVRRREVELEQKEEVIQKEDETKQKEIEKIEIIKTDPFKGRASEPPKDTSSSKEFEELKKEKLQLEQTIQDQQLRVWTLEEQNKRVERIVKMMDSNEPSEDDITQFIETIKEIVNRKKQKLRFILTQKIVDTFSRYVQNPLSLSAIITPRGSIRKSEKKKDKRELQYIQFIPNKIEEKRKTSLIVKDNYEMYRTVCYDFYVKEGEYYRIINEFNEVYIKNINWSIMKDFAKEFKELFEPILMLTKKIVDELDRAYSDPIKDAEGKSCIALGSILEKYAQTLRVYLNYILRCPYFVDHFPVFSQSKELTDSLVLSITNYINSQRLNNPSFVVNSFLPISAYILAPVSHFSVYPQLMRELAMNISNNHFDNLAVQNALRIIEGIEDEIDRQKNSAERCDAVRFVKTLFVKTIEIPDGHCELLYFGFLKPVDIEKFKVHDDIIRVCFLFNTMFIITKIKTFQGKVLDKKALTAKFYQEISGLNVEFLKGFILEEVDRCFITDHIIISLIQNIGSIINGFTVEFNEKQYNFVASSQKQQYNWCDAFSNLM
ncbi:Hypothetical protein EHI5A_039060 [Entamoeba histolytica KU27]|uniref:DH domain-containing protein n=1 Tax=Entamoeba histolytica KU27 TaxID=885311 RepID=M2S7P5_ENTHI|nr:Hypothetical protein EHI5A_039060 [Entamoeba histolytica KU27]